MDWLIIANAQSDAPIELSNVDPLIFYQILLYIYTGTCDILNIGECPVNLKNLAAKRKTKDDILEESEDYIDGNISAFEFYSNKKNNRNKNRSKEQLSPTDPVRFLQEAAKRFGLKNLCKKLDGLIYENGFIQKKPGKINSFNEKLNFDRAFKDMYDVIIKTKNGKEISAHKCILSTRLEYFNNLFAVRWNMVSKIHII